MESAQGEMAVGDQRAHLELRGQREGLAVVTLCVAGWVRVLLRGDIAEKTEGVGLVSSFSLCFKALLSSQIVIANRGGFFL